MCRGVPAQNSAYDGSIKGDEEVQSTNWSECLCLSLLIEWNHVTLSLIIGGYRIPRNSGAFPTMNDLLDS